MNLSVLLLTKMYKVVKQEKFSVKYKGSAYGMDASDNGWQHPSHLLQLHLLSQFVLPQGLLTL